MINWPEARGPGPSLKLALVSGEYPPAQGGVGDYTRELAAAFLRCDAAVRVITMDSASRSSSAPSNAPGDVPLSSPLPSASDAACELAHAPLRSWRGLPAVHTLARDSDIVHIEYQAAAYGMTAPVHALPRYLRARLAHRPVVVTFHDLRVPYLFPKAGPLRRRAILYMARSCAAVVVTNQEDFEKLTAELDRMPAPARPALLMIPIGSNIDAQAPPAMDRAAARAALGVAADEHLLCYFGFLNASKGGETLMRVLARVAQTGRKVRLLMLGGEVGASDPTNAAYAAQVKTLVSTLGLDPLVIWAGYRAPSEVTAFWAASDIALLPYVDGASLRRGTLMAALAHAMPIVTTTPRVPVAHFHDGENIALAPAEDVDALANLVLSLAGSPALRAQLSQGAALLAREFTWPRIADRHLELYRSLLARAAQRSRAVGHDG